LEWCQPSENDIQHFRIDSTLADPWWFDPLIIPFLEVIANWFQEVIVHPFIRDIVQRSLWVIGAEEQINLEIFDISTGILRLRNVNKGLELKSSARYNIIFVSPFWLLENVLEKKKFKTIEQDFFCQGAEKPLDEESEEGVINFIFEVLIC